MLKDLYYLSGDVIRTFVTFVDSNVIKLVPVRFCAEGARIAL